MQYQEAIDFLYSRLPLFQRVGKAAYKEGLGNILLLDEYFGHPHRKFKTIHVAGTNGKGSVSHMLAAILQCAGYRTGLYTSPHLTDFRERIKIDGKFIPQKEIIEFIEQHQEVIHTIQPSFFELTVAMAYDYFARKQVDVAVIETGLGGRLDSTNIITPEVSVITNISRDHTDLLGDTLSAIAREKAGIIKPGVPVVISEEQEEVREVFIQKAQECESDILFASRLYRVTEREANGNGVQTLHLEDREGNHLVLESDLLGIYQVKNIPAVLTAISVLRKKGIQIHDKQILEGIRNTVKLTGLHGRWEIVGHNPLIVCDTGHNEAGIREVMTQVFQTPHNKLHIVFGTVKDKPLELVLQLLPQKAFYYFTRADIPRALDEKNLAEKAKEFGLYGTTYPDVPSAVKATLEKADRDDMILVGGSTFVVADFLSNYH